MSVRHYGKYDPGDKMYNQPIQIGIIMATYYRPNGKSLSKITRAIDSIKDQSYGNWKLFFIGDKYEDEEEFQKIIDMVPKNKIIYKNLDHAVERELFQTGKINQKQLWNTAGSNAMREGLILAKEYGIKYVAHLDDDDYWYKTHLFHLWRAFIDFPNADFIYTSGYWGNGLICPYFYWNIYYNNMQPKTGFVLHSAVAWNIENIPILYHKITKDNLDQIIEKDNTKIIDYPADALLWTMISNYCHENNLNYLYLPVLTVVHTNLED